MRGVLEVDCRVLKENIRKIRTFLGKRIAYFSVVKADAYGIGVKHLVPVLDPEVDGFAVANVDEAEEVRELTSKKILILSPVLPWERERVFGADATPLVSSLDECENFEAIAQKLNCNLDVHLSVDTGMGRVGLWFSEVDTFFKGIENFKRVHLTGISTHFSSLLSDSEFTRLQLSRLEQIAEKYSQNHYLLHASSSFGISEFLGNYCNAVRIGALQYGIASEKGIDFLKKLGLSPILRFYGWITSIKRVPEGSMIGYDRSCQLLRDSRIALSSIGYADGISPELSNKGQVLIHGQKCPIVGKISMDQAMIDITDLQKKVQIGDRITFWGSDEDQEISLNEFTQAGNRLLRQGVTDLSTRVERRLIFRY